MAARPLPITQVPAQPVAVAAVLSATLVGAALAADVPTGVAVLVALCYAPLVFVDVGLGLALWVPLIFLQAVPELNLGAKAGGLLIAFAWLGTLRGRSVAPTIGLNRGALAWLALLLVWLSLSVAWADARGMAIDDIWRWYAVGLLFLILVTTIATPSLVRMLVAMFVAGTLLSVVVGAVAPVAAGANAAGTRLEGAAGDPNFLAALIVSAVVLAVGLGASSRSLLLRWVLALAVGGLVIGFFAAASRGGFLAALIAVVAALLVFKRRRIYVVALALVALGVAVPWFSASPESLERITRYEDGGNGRTDLWKVGWRMSKDHPLVGVGLNNFRAFSPDYVRQPGTLEAVNLIVDRPHFVHNTYLQQLAETGIVGLALFLGFVASCLRAAWLAAVRFEARGDHRLELLARAVLVASIAMAGAALFLSAGVDQRLWLLLGLGPALLAVSMRAEPDATGRRAAA